MHVLEILLANVDVSFRKHYRCAISVFLGLLLVELSGLSEQQINDRRVTVQFIGNNTAEAGCTAHVITAPRPPCLSHLHAILKC